MEETVVGGTALIVLIIIWGILAVYHRFLLPRIKKEKIQERVYFIAGLLGITPDHNRPLPAISVLEQSELFQLLPPEKAWNYVSIFGLWIKEWNRILFSKTHDREDTFCHEIVHSLQDTYWTVAMTPEEKEIEAERITRIYLQLRFPFQYFFLIICYGFFGIWGFEIFKDPIFEPI